MIILLGAGPMEILKATFKILQKKRELNKRDVVLRFSCM